MNQFCYREILDKTWLWPKNDIKSWKFLTQEQHLTFPVTISNLLTKKRTVVQAGGHCGLYPYQYSSLFNDVYTFEIDQTNYACLTENLKDLKNVNVFNVGLSNVQERKGILFDKKNAGKHMVSTFGNNISLTTIDSMKIQNIDLIHLDIEGYELFALQGARESINKFKPLIVIEANNLCLNYNYSLQDIDDWMFSVGYKKIIEWPGDWVYKSIM